MAGVWCVRVHEVRASADAVRVVAAVQAAERPAGPRAGGPAPTSAAGGGTPAPAGGTLR
jgi:dihydropteroate synthase